MSRLPVTDKPHGEEWTCVWDLSASKKDTDPLSANLHHIWDSGATRLSLWQSVSTGLRVAVGTLPDPIIWGSFVVRTESFCDDGCPHTLEHLVFMGSKNLPYKGILDEIAKRNFSSGTNATTQRVRFLILKMTSSFLVF
jgi:hypothetical protein